jgi:hypothetical protein
MPYSKEQARTALDRISDPTVREAISPYFTAIIEETLPQYYCDLFKHERDDFSDELTLEDPRDIISRKGETNLWQYKCQPEVVRAIGFNLVNAIADEVITDPAFIEDIRTFRKQCDIEPFKYDGGPEDVSKLARINAMLNKTIVAIRKEQAEHALTSISNLTTREIIEPYFTAIIEGTLPQYYLDQFSFFKHDYSDELPLEDVRTIIEQSDGINSARAHQYKCQGNFVLGLNATLQSAVLDEVIRDEAFMEDIEMLRHSDLRFAVGDPKNVERLARVNGILDRVIEYLTPMVPAEQRPQPSSR